MTVSPPPMASPREIPVGPSLDAWRAMTPRAREGFLVAMNEALTEAAELMGEGRPHKQAKSRAIDLLGLHFKAKGRTVYLAEELSVLYPGERAFAPDVLAVVDVPQPEDDERLAWVVADEGRGIDVALEVLHRGDREKDLIDNVDRYARLGIPEYFVYDREKQRVHGYRLATADARRYDRVVPQAGRIASRILGVDLAVQHERLRFFDGMAELFGSDDLIHRLTDMVESLESKAEAEQARAEAALGGLRGAILGAYAARFGASTDALRRALDACEDPALLQAALLATVTAQDPDAPIAALDERR